MVRGWLSVRPVSESAFSVLDSGCKIEETKDKLGRRADLSFEVTREGGSWAGWALLFKQVPIYRIAIEV